MRYLREHFKHSSLDLTVLYSLSEKQDTELYAEIVEIASEFLRGLMSNWLSGGSKISGGHAQHIIQQREAFQGMTKASKRALLKGASSEFSIRGTGHSWCLSANMGCGGHGLYDAISCGGCSGSVIDESQKDIWVGLGRQQLELLAVKDIGAGGTEKVRSSMKIIEKVLFDLDVELSELSPFEQVPTPL